MANPRARVPLAIGVTVAAAGGYYFYAAGGDAKVAQKKVEADAARIGGSREKSAQKQGEEFAQELGSKLDHTVDEARAKITEADQKIGNYTKDLSKQVSSEVKRVESETAKELKDTVNAFDKTVERKTAEAKSGISSWFGFGKERTLSPFENTFSNHNRYFAFIKFSKVEVMLSMKRRKLTITENRKAPLPGRQQSIQSFGRIFKAQAPPEFPNKKQPIGESAEFTVTAEEEPSCTNVKKRKLARTEDLSKVEQGSEAAHNGSILQKSATRSRSGELVYDLPVKRALRIPCLVQSRKAKEEPPSNDQANCADEDKISCQSSLSPPRSCSLEPQSSISPISSSVAVDAEEVPCERQIKLPEELQDIVNLHSAFLTALSLHYAHNGSLTPADVRLLSPSIERSWGKRKVSIDDIRRLMGILDKTVQSVSECFFDSTGRTFRLLDYGGGKICVEMLNPHHERGFMANHIEEDKLNARFASMLRKRWLRWKQLVAEKESWKGTQESIEESKQRSINDEVDATLSDNGCLADFISALPMAHITICSSLSKIKPMLARGQRRLIDLKSSAIKRNNSSMNRQVVSSVSPSSKTARGRGQNLMERIRSKELHQSTLPLQPSKASLNRISSFHRLEEVIQVLTVLTNSETGSATEGKCIGQRVSFTLPALLQILQSSLRNPISREESESCMRLLAQEVAPEWMNIAVIGGVTGVVMERGRRPEPMEIKRRIECCIR